VTGIGGGERNNYLNSSDLLVNQADYRGIVQFTTVIFDHVEQSNIWLSKLWIGWILQSTTNSFQSEGDFPKTPDQIGLELQF
jgi:hypothetical protein